MVVGREGMGKGRRARCVRRGVGRRGGGRCGPREGGIRRPFRSGLVRVEVKVVILRCGEVRW